MKRKKLFQTPYRRQRRLSKEMNYIKLINQFWLVRRRKNLTSTQADLYFALLHECNEQDWTNPFSVTNKRICASIEISERVLIDSRNRLQQAGLIEFKNGINKKRAPQYLIIIEVGLLKVSQQGSQQGGQQGSQQSSQQGCQDGNIYNKPNKTETKPKDFEPNGSMADEKLAAQRQEEKEKKLAAKKEKEDRERAELYWNENRNVWFEFYKNNFTEEPKFEGLEAVHLKNVLKRLKKLSISKGYEWNGFYAQKVFLAFLSKAIKDKWIKNNFLLPTLYSKFDAIINRQDGQQNNDPKGAIAAIDAMPG